MCMSRVVCKSSVLFDVSYVDLVQRLKNAELECRALRAGPGSSRPGADSELGQVNTRVFVEVVRMQYSGIAC